MAASEVFADTSALYALVNRRDAHHAAVSAALTRVVRAGRLLVTSDYVVTETVNLANIRGDKLVAGRVLDLIEQSVGIRVEWIGVERFERTKVFFRKHADHGYSFTDCSSFVVMKEARIVDALTTDGHFAEAGFKPLLPVG